MFFLYEIFLRNEVFTTFTYFIVSLLTLVLIKILEKDARLWCLFFCQHCSKEGDLDLYEDGQCLFGYLDSVEYKTTKCQFWYSHKIYFEGWIRDFDEYWCRKHSFINNITPISILSVNVLELNDFYWFSFKRYSDGKTHHHF